MKKFLPLPCVLVILSLSGFGQSKNNKPNILIILADDLGYHDVSYYGTSDLRTPNIDMLCKAGMRFDNFYENSPVCSPTRASLMSGRYPEMVGVPGLVRSKPEDNFGFLKADAMLLPKLLKEANYKTALIGKWNLGLETPNTPNEKGFDYFHGWLDDMMEDYWTHLRNGLNFLREDAKEINPKGHATDLFSEWGVDYIHQQTKSKPFFLYLAYTAPHFPVQPPEDWLAKVKARYPGISERRAKLVALIEHMDDGIGKVVQSLKEGGLYENTLIVFLSDNGVRGMGCEVSLPRTFSNCVQILIYIIVHFISNLICFT
jgi:arylsulfatase A-like enzyme